MADTVRADAPTGSIRAGLGRRELLLMISAVMRDDPRPLTEIRRELPNHLGRVVRRCLEKDPEHRFQTAKDVRNELEGLRREVDSSPRPAAAAKPPVAGVRESGSFCLCACPRVRKKDLGRGGG